MSSWNYDRIKDEAKARGVQVNDMIALAPANDPFYSGRPADRVLAQWFADLWDRFGYGSGVHLRRVHYQIISQKPAVKLPEGMRIKVGTDEHGQPITTDTYLNYDACWNLLTQASKHARYLQLVDPAAFDDRRNPATVVNAKMDAANPVVYIDDRLYNVPRLPDFPSLPSLWMSGYEGRQRYMIEIWCEKSTMNDVLIPLCEEYGANLQTGLGELSITATLNAVTRVVESGRPTRIFYVSDYDPAGQSMPVAVARKIEYFIRQSAEDLDIRLQPVVLTADQIEIYGLPRTPIKETEKRAARFEERNGAGAVELDALEALHPGTLAEILREEIDHYYDADLGRRVRDAEREVERQFASAQDRAAAPYRDQIDHLRGQYAEIRQRFEQEISDYAAEQRKLWQAIAAKLRDEVPSMADHPIPEARETARDWEVEPLYDSSRSYTEQLASYKQFQGKESIEI